MTVSNSLLAASSAQASDESAARIAALEAEVSNLLAELDDLTLLYEVTTEHGEAVENHRQRLVSEHLRQSGRNCFDYGITRDI